MTSPEYRWPNCWIRGHMDPRDYQDDPVRLCTIECPWRKGHRRSFGFISSWDAMDYDCTNPAIQEKAVVERARQMPNGGIMAGGSVDDFATFCPAVDMHLTSLGEPSRLIYDAVARDVYPELPAPGDTATENVSTLLDISDHSAVGWSHETEDKTPFSSP